MWYGTRMSAEADADFVSCATDLLRSTSQHIIGLAGVILVFWLLFATDALFPISLAVALAAACSLWWLSRSVLAAQAAWQLGLAAVITLTVCVSGRPEVVFFYTLLPLMAAVSIGWPAALAAGAMVSALVHWLAAHPQLVSLPPGYETVFLAVAAISGLIGWIATHNLMTVTQWSLFSFEQARRKVEEARDQRLELKQAQEDLMLATSELARITHRLQAMHQIAEEARQAKEQFVANVSHELRTPLNMIIGFSEMIMESPRAYGTPLPPALLADIEVIYRNSQHLAKLVNDVLDLSQVEAGRMALSREWSALRTVIEEAVLAVRALYETKGLYLELEVPEDLPLVFCDSTRIRQVVLNLLSNAGRFTERGGVRIRAWHEGGGVVVSVADTGPGISPDDQKKLFEPFQQLDGSIRRPHEGSGLGLSISRRLVELHGGTMWLESAVGIGSTIFFRLPLTPSVASAGTERDIRRWLSPYHQYQSRTRPSRAPVPRVLPRFVVLEHGSAVSRLFGRYVDGAEVVSVSTAEEAAAELSRSPASALIVNAGSRDTLGEPTPPLPSLPYGTPVITCWVPTEIDAARRLGVVHYLTKPVSRDTLLATLSELGPGCRSVLVVDDEPEMLQLFARMISTAKPRYQPLLAASGQRALELLRQHRPDVMLLDLLMPGVDGFQVLREKSRDPAIQDIPVVVISSRNPAGEPIVSNSLAVARSGGLSARDLLDCTLAVSDILSSSPQPDRGRRGNPVS
ncbi:MAG: hybrid sensor histidine kinase/response regulator [Anaerolineae bacterium]|nr:hybrid sensor histidine kinase/response regulator [Anaerolineae bacterium]